MKTGKSTKKWLILFSILFFISLFGEELTISILKTLNIEITILIKNLSTLIWDCLFILAATATCYFDGKLDGLIESHRN